MKFCTEIDHQSLTSNMKKDLHKINDVIDIEGYIDCLTHHYTESSVVQKYTKQIKLILL